MILVIIFLIFSSQSAVGQEIEAQLPLETLLERSIAYVKRPALVEWRKSSVLIGLETGQSIEYNDFNGRSYGINLREDAF
ncbi:MAG: hypothetical protein NTX25_02490 [Proteobacteria bacterium]|nr:hypothetical protein [Pseudomonadota bacterium]